MPVFYESDELFCSFLIGYSHTGRQINFADKALEKFDIISHKNNLADINKLNERLLEDPSI